MSDSDCFDARRVTGNWDGLLSRQQIAAAGVPEAVIRGRLRARTWMSVHQGVLRVAAHTVDADGGVWADLRAALLTQAPDGHWPAGLAVGRQSAGELYGFEGMPSASGVQLVVPRVWQRHHRPTGVRLHRCATAGRHVVDIGGLPVTNPAWTAVTLMRGLDLGRAVVLADAALRTGRCGRDDLAATIPYLTGLRGCVDTRRAIDLARVGTDSCQETTTRLVLLDGGLPEPEVDLRLYDDQDRLLARGDLGYSRLLIWLEYDGFAVHSRRDVFRRDRARQNWLVDRGWYVLRYTDDDLRTAGRRMVHEVRRARQHSLTRIRALPRGLSPEADAARLALGA